jgi:Putative transposase
MPYWAHGYHRCTPLHQVDNQSRQWGWCFLQITCWGGSHTHSDLQLSRIVLSIDPLVVLFYFPVERIAPLHANTHVPAPRRDQVERLMRYTARGAVSLERLAQDANGDLLYRYTRPWADGTPGRKLSPVARLEQLAA